MRRAKERKSYYEKREREREIDRKVHDDFVERKEERTTHYLVSVNEIGNIWKHSALIGLEKS